ncbi:dTDP-4-dehydrorhamnose reductase [Massilia sp. W12]|uniref:dTDP-4-dehydrorhamnose reductase n=1 Tax=Massilia sp. W12 TaxID=3126507 RepID=UPI0030D125C9
MKPRILVTGVNGQLGYELQRALQGLGQIIGLDRHALDLSNPSQVEEQVRAMRPQLIVNPAAYTAVDKAESEAELAWRINAESVGAIGRAAKACGAGVIHYSTDYVYDGAKDGVYREDDPTAPLGVYGASKLGGEDALRASGAPHLILRTSWVYGMRGKNFLLTMLRLMQEREQLRVVNDQIGAPTWCRSIADATAHALARAPLADAAQSAAWWEQHQGVYHLTCQGAASWYDFTAAIMALRPPPRPVDLQPIPSSAYPTPAKRPANSRLDCSKFMSHFCDLPEWRSALELCLAP